MNKIPFFADQKLFTYEAPVEYVINSVVSNPIIRRGYAPTLPLRLSNACYNGDLELVKELFLIEEQIDSLTIENSIIFLANTPLDAASRAGHAHIVRWLLAQRALPEEPNSLGFTLKLAMESTRDTSECMIALMNALGGSIPEIAPDQLAICHAANFALALSWMSPSIEKANRILFVRSPKSCSQSIDALLALGARIDHEDPDTGLTPLIHAITIPGNYLGRSKAIECLMGKGANTNHKTGIGLTPLTSAALIGSKTICMALLDHGANPLESLTPEYFPQAVHGLLPSFAADAGRHAELANYLRSVECAWSEALTLSVETQPPSKKNRSISI